MYLDGDDVLLPNHVAVRLAVAETDQWDLIGFETATDWNQFHRDTRFEYGKVGHAEIVLRTEFLRKLNPSPPSYGHDFLLVENAIHSGARHFIQGGQPYTYVIKSTPEHPEIRK